MYFHWADVTKAATDKRMRKYCYGESDSDADEETYADGSDSDFDMDDLLGGIKEISSLDHPPRAKIDVNETVCRRLLISRHLTPAQPFVPKSTLHECCDLCHNRCQCGHCPDLPGICFTVDDGSNDSDHSSTLLRNITESQKKQNKTGASESEGFIQAD